MFRRVSSLDRGLDAFERRQWKRARRLLEEALADEDRAMGRYHLGLLYWRGLGGRADKSTAVEHFARAAEGGLPAAQTAYGIALRSGVGVGKDVERAREQFRAAAGALDGNAMVQLATLSDPDEARYWLLRASEIGHAPAMAQLADLLTDRDPIDGLAWLYAAVSLNGDEAARKRATVIARQLRAKEIEEAQRIGRAYAKEAQQRSRGR
jgi:TPR repeat protein